MKKEIHLSLTGGLGNQLFQLAAALSYPGARVVVETNTGRPRLNGNGEVEVMSFHLPQNIVISNRQQEHWLQMKAIGYGLRMGISPKSYEKFPLTRYFVLFGATIINSLFCKEFIPVWFSPNIGFSPLPFTKKILLVGYFQSYKWPSSLNSQKALQGLRLREESAELHELRDRANKEHPLVVHIRLGDYLSEDSFGNLSAEYYEKSISKMWKSGEYKKIWVFSDDIELAKAKVPRNLLKYCDWIHQVGDSSASTLEAMRLGKGYVLANSTFSWWGCFLSYEINPKAIAPKPWFKNEPRPRDITPPNWELMPVDYSVVS